MKGVVLAGGTGSRLGLLTRGVNKHLLPVGDKPMVCHAISKLAEVGVTEQLLVTGITDLDSFQRVLGDGNEFEVNLQYAGQEQPGGIAQAVGMARSFADGGRVAVLLADNYFEGTLRGFLSDFKSQWKGARVLLYPGAPGQNITAMLHESGVADFGVGHSLRLRQIVEKPSDPPSPYVVTGAYLYDPEVFDVIDGLKPSQRGELEITDVNNHYASLNKLEHSFTMGFWADAGSSIENYHRVCRHAMPLPAVV